MKKIISLVLIILICCLCFTACGKFTADSKNSSYMSNSSLKEINAVYDRYDNILQQVFYDSLTNKYIIKEYTYIYEDGMFICNSQNTVILDKQDFINNNT